MSIRNLIYRGPVKLIIEKLGLRQFMATSYARLKFLYQNEPIIKIRGEEAQFITSNLIEFKRILYQSGEREILSDIALESKPDDVIWDVGANIGVYTCVLGKHIPQGRMVAFEPHPKNLERLKKNIGINGVNAGVYQLALSDTEETMEFSLENDIPGEGHGHLLPNVSRNQTISVETIQGDSIPDRISETPPNIVKIDVEGAEMNVLKGMSNILDREDCRLVYCEVHVDHLSRFGSSPGQISEFLVDRDFDVERFCEFGDGGSYCLKGKK